MIYDLIAYPFHQLSLVRHRACATQFMVLQKGTLMDSSFYGIGIAMG